MNPSLRLDLSLEEANLVLEALGQLPYTRVHALVAKIHQQAVSQLEPGDESARPGPERTTP
jgi:hypothetical protein